MIPLGTTVDSLDELLEMLKADEDFDVARYKYNDMTKSLTIYDSDNIHTIITLKNDDQGKIVVKKIW
ncbi:MAG: hypothetical protein IIZ64_04755 [Erysipelotrichaceae bacterium]|nr:hypothetical protein [Erysipelotrichaceae bacterium]MBQ1534106.1 hypothetical protein [Erysipelotrichaceae bacterium]MBQ1787709.1 hypothetical protein [Erysipelotrichaceae bacterium]MBQ2659085.1 hypothetical protein [Erysipelotrichaceae bacterium]MBQ5804831.1 hypothetical protein [Erysipelotrichaceae bacterium]